MTLFVMSSEVETSLTIRSQARKRHSPKRRFLESVSPARIRQSGSDLYPRLSTSRFRDAKYRHLDAAEGRKIFRAFLRAISRRQTLECRADQGAVRPNERPASDWRTGRCARVSESARAGPVR